MLVSFVHSIKMCFIMYWFPHRNLGGGSSFRMKEWVNLVCPMRSRVRVVSSLLILLGSIFLSFEMGCTCKSLLWGFFSHNCCHFFVITCLNFGLRSVEGIFNSLSGIILRAYCVSSMFSNPLRWMFSLKKQEKCSMDLWEWYMCTILYFTKNYWLNVMRIGTDLLRQC